MLNGQKKEKNDRLRTELRRAKKRSERYKKQIAELEEQLIRRESDFMSVAENSPDVICRFSKTFRHIYVNPALTKTTGFPSTNFLGKTPHQAGLSPDFADFWITSIKTVFSNASPHSTEFSFPTPDGEKFFQTLLVPEFSSHGDVVTVLSMTRDITEMKVRNQRQEEVLGIASHELKTPLTSLKAFTQILHSRFIKKDDIDSATYLTKMQQQVDKLNNLVTELLDVTRVSSGKSRFVYNKFNFDALVKEIIEDMQRTTTQHKIEVRGKTNKYVIADKNKIGQVLMNLLSNAIKYSPKADRIIVQLVPNSDGVMCWVQDFGLGIPKEKQNLIFDRYYRVNDGVKSPTGLGLGLYITAEIIERHGGKIWVNSELNKGSTFCFTLPSQNLSQAKKD
jgi:PAS domain S-box-containing protein